MHTISNFNSLLEQVIKTETNSSKTNLGTTMANTSIQRHSKEAHDRTIDLFGLSTHIQYFTVSTHLLPGAAPKELYI